MKRTKDFNTNKGITLIALVITIIVMLILVGVTISMAVNGGLFDYAGRAVSETNEALKAEQALAEGGVKVGENWYNSIDEYLIASGNKTAPVEKISKTESYIGCYADVDGNGTVDGVIYADLAFASEENASWSYGYSYDAIAEEDLKDYYVSKTNYEGDFGTKDVLTATGDGEDRFYVMALEDFTEAGNYYCWYDAAYDEGMSDYETYTSTAFGTGKANTAAMITKWNNAGYGPKDDNATYKDIWGQIQTLASKGWFVPSVAEWDAFADAFDVYAEWDENYENYTIPYGLSHCYWSSSPLSTHDAWFVSFYYGDVMDLNGVDNCDCVRLSATF